MRVAVVVVRGDSILLVRHQKGAASYWLLPGGGVDFGEPLAEALRREVREETCLDVRVGDLILASDSIAPDGSRHVVNLCFEGEVVGGELGLGSDERVVEARYVSSDELHDLALRPDLRDELAKGLETGFGSGDVYVGERWTRGP
ncbi:MAG: NUDIX hydrolase [Candidatus Hydrogenedentes bacterium]|nr:NUDIX hydrolase [Candidatus Hydrogenedentota bacterium]